MLPLGFRNPSSLLLFKKIKAVTIIELLVGTTVFLGVSFGAYEVYTKTTQRAQASQKQAKYSRGLKTFLERFRHEVENAVQLPNAESSVMELNRPVNCPDPSNADSSEHLTKLAWGMIPYPGKNKADITNTLAPFDPAAQTVDETTHANDAVLMVYIAEDSAVNFLAYSDPPTNTVLEPSNGDTLTVAGVAKNLEVGDYAVVSDALRKELIRITGKTVATNTTIKHESSKSIWNQDFSNPLSSTSALGQPLIYKVNVVTYALDADTQTLVKDDHTLDDNFNPETKNFGTPGLKNKWDAVAPNVSKFQVVYVRMDETETRKPQIGLPVKTYDNCSVSGASANCGCENELGNPKLKTVKAIISFSKPENSPTGPASVADTSVESFNPTILKKGLPFLSIDHAGCDPQGNALYTTISGSPNTACDSTYCICSDTWQPSLCNPATEPNHCCGSGATWNGSICVGNGGSGGPWVPPPPVYGSGGTG